MQVDTGAFRALTEQVAEMAARLGQLERKAFIFTAAEEVFAGTHVIEAAYAAGRAREREGTPPRLAGRRPRHLRAVDGGAS